MLEFKLQLGDLNYSSVTVQRQLRKRWVAGSIPSGDKYFQFIFFACSCSSKLGGAHAHEIIHPGYD